MPVSLVIRKQKFSIRTGDEQLAMRLRRQVNDELQYSLLDVYNEVMNANDAGFDQDIYIDKITVDLGCCTEEQWVVKLRQLLKKKLEASMGGYEMPDSGVFADDEHSRDAKISGEEKISVVTGQHNESTALLYYLEKGIYPWWFAGPATATATKKPGEIIAAMPDGILESVLIKLVAGSYGETAIERMRRRFVQALAPVEYQRVISLLISIQSDENWKTNIDLLCENSTERYLASFTSISEEIYRVQLIQFLLQHVRGGKAGLKEFIEQLLEYTGTVSIQISPPAKSAQVHEKVKEIIIQLAADKSDQPMTAMTPGDTRGTNTSHQTAGTEDKMPGKKQIPAREESAFPEEGIYIDNGGLVLLHPFLQPLFEEFGLIKDGEFVAEQAKQRAAVLLYYLHQGVSEYEEHQMAFNKVLCGMMPEDVLPADILLTDEERKECEQLLDTVVGYWDALKSASRSALQETFLKRRAKLRFNGDYWLLQVERNAMDILIDRLPWGFGIIKLPWLKQLIHVEW